MDKDMSLPEFHRVNKAQHKRITKLEDALKPFVDACVGSWGTMREPTESDFQVGFIIPMRVWKKAKQALEGK